MLLKAHRFVEFRENFPHLLEEFALRFQGIDIEPDLPGNPHIRCPFSAIDIELTPGVEMIKEPLPGDSDGVAISVLEHPSCSFSSSHSLGLCGASSFREVKILQCEIVESDRLGKGFRVFEKRRDVVRGEDDAYVENTSRAFRSAMGYTS